MIILDYKNVDIDKLMEERLYRLKLEQKKREREKEKNKEIAEYLLDRSEDLKLLSRVIEDLANELAKEEVSDTKVKICLLTLEALGKELGGKI